MFHDLDDAVDGVLVNLSGVRPHGRVVVPVELVRCVGNVPQALLVQLQVGRHREQPDALLAGPLCLQLDAPTRAAGHVTVGDDHREVDHTLAHVPPDLLGHVGQHAIGEGAPTEGADALQALGEGGPVAAWRAEHLYQIGEVQATVAPAQGHLVQVELILQLADELQHELLHVVEQAVSGGLHGDALRCVQHEVHVDRAVGLLWAAIPVRGAGADDLLLLSMDGPQEPPEQEGGAGAAEHLGSTLAPRHPDRASDALVGLVRSEEAPGPDRAAWNQRTLRIRTHTSSCNTYLC